MNKTCKACEHPERNVIEEALREGEAYRELTRQFSVPIGALRRHRKAHLDRQEEAGVRDSTHEPAYLRLGDLPEGGVSRNYSEDWDEEGLSVFSARKTSGGGYTFDVPLSLGRRDVMKQLGALFILIIRDRLVYEAFGQEIEGEKGSSGEPLLENASLEPIPPFVRLALPKWLGAEGQKLADLWGSWRMSKGSRTTQTTKMTPRRAIGNQVVQVLVAAERTLYPEDGFKDSKSRRCAFRREMPADVRRFMGWNE